MGLACAVSVENACTSGAWSPCWNAATARAHARSISVSAWPAGGHSTSAATANGSSTRARRGSARIMRRVNTIRCTAVTLAMIASTQRAGSMTSRIAPVIRQISRSGRSIIPTVHSTPIDSARAFV